MPSHHAVLSPSSSERWISCPASIRAIEEADLPPDTGSVYAREGTSAHTIAEITADERLNNADRTTDKIAWHEDAMREGFDIDDMKRHASAYTDLLSEFLSMHDESVLMLEQRLPTGIPSSWGTSDAVIVSPSVVHVVDYKYGQGVPVAAEENSQLKLYGVGALDAYGEILGDAGTVYFTIHQPRIGNTSTWSLPAADLRAWRDSIIPIAEEALIGSWRFGPSETACRWCPIAGQCRARMEYMTQRDFAPADTLTPEEIGELLPLLPDIREWVSQVQNYALDLAYSKGEPIPGWKVVRSSGRRTIVDHAAAVQTLIDEGFYASAVADFRVKPFGQLDKLLGKNGVEKYLGNLVEKSPGAPALVPESDRRAPITPDTEARKDFE